MSPHILSITTRPKALAAEESDSDPYRYNSQESSEDRILITHAFFSTPTSLRCQRQVVINSFQVRLFQY